MLIRNRAGGVYLYASDTSGNPVTGDANNITGSYSLDGGSAGSLNWSVSEIGSGVYWQPLQAAETDGVAFAYLWASSTPNVVIEPVIGFTTTLPIDSNLVSSLGEDISNEDFVLAGATTTTVTLPNTIPDDQRYEYTALRVIGGAGSGQLVLLTTATSNPRQYNVLEESMPVPLGSDSRCVVVGPWRSHDPLGLHKGTSYLFVNPVTNKEATVYFTDS